MHYNINIRKYYNPNYFYLSSLVTNNNNDVNIILVIIAYVLINMLLMFFNQQTYCPLFVIKHFAERVVMKPSLYLLKKTLYSRKLPYTFSRKLPSWINTVLSQSYNWSCNPVWVNTDQTSLFETYKKLFLCYTENTLF